MKIIPLKGGDEWDAFSRRARRHLRFGPGVKKAIRRGFWKRVRATLKKHTEVA